MGAPTIDLTDKKFDLFFVIERAGSNRRKNRLWRCICNCGKEFIAPTTDLKSGAKKSCGCHIDKSGSKNPKWRGHGEISGSYWNRFKNNASIRNIKVDISIEDAWELFLKQDKKCNLSGESIEMCSYPGKTKERLLNQTASLDRKNSLEGYTIDNIQWIHKKLNRLKMEVHDKEFIEWCIKVAKHQESKNERN